MAQYENRWRGEGRDWRDDDREPNRHRDWGGGPQRTGVYGQDDDRRHEGMYRRQAHRQQDDQGHGYRDAGYGGRVGNESGGYGRESIHDSDDRRGDTSREMERVYDRNFGGGRDMSRGGYGADYGGYERDDRDRSWGEDRGSMFGGREGRGDYGGGYADDRYERRGDERGRNRGRGFWEQAGDEIASWFGDDDTERRRHEDERRAAQHRGRGPRGYSRSDERVREDVSDRLTDDAYIDASDVEVTVSGGEVTLTGMVPDRHTKRRAEDVAESVSGVSHVQNNLRVRSQTGSQSGTGWGSSTGAGASAMATAGSDTTAGTSGGPAGASAGTGSMGGSTAGVTGSTGRSPTTRS